MSHSIEAFDCPVCPDCKSKTVCSYSVYTFEPLGWLKLQCFRCGDRLIANDENEYVQAVKAGAIWFKEEYGDKDYVGAEKLMNLTALDIENLKKCTDKFCDYKLPLEASELAGKNCPYCCGPVTPYFAFQDFTDFVPPDGTKPC